MEGFINVFANTLLGETLFAELLAYFVLAMVGAIFYMKIRVNARHKSDNGKPEKWSWSFFIKDNLDRVLLTLVLVFIWASHGHTVITHLPEWASEIGKGIYIVIGFLTDLIVVYTKQAYKFLNKWIKAKFKALTK